MFEDLCKLGPIKCAAWKWKNKDESPDAPAHITTGTSHAECLRTMIKAGAHPTNRRNPEFECQGFLTANGSFVGREDAYIIAKQYNQLTEGERSISNSEHPKLFSEFCIFINQN